MTGNKMQVYATEIYELMTVMLLYCPSCVCDH